MTIIKELPLLEGNISVKGRLAYVSQQPWVISATIRDNIVFGDKFSKSLYETITKACALDKVCILSSLVERSKAEFHKTYD